MCTELDNIERRLIDIEKLLNRSYKDRYPDNHGVPEAVAQGIIKSENEPLKDERGILEMKRQFILDRRDNNFWKIIWLIAGGICVFVTEYLLKLFALQ